MFPIAKRLNLLQSKADCENNLVEFIKQAWHIVEPANPYVHGWHIDAIAQHLDALTHSLLASEEDYDPEQAINRLLINIPPGLMKSLCCSVFYPAWLWCKEPHLRILCASHSQSLAIRDSMKMRRLVSSDWYVERWGDTVKLTGDQNAKSKFETTAGGFREAVAAGSITGSRGDVLIIDDPHSVEGALSDAMRETTKTWFLEAVPTRLNNPKRSAIIVIMQRLHEEDVSGLILDRNLGYTHVCLPMEYDPLRRCRTDIGFEDPRTEEGELLFPERFPIEVVERDKAVMGPYAVAGQFQQTPSPRGGGIIPRNTWQLYDEETAAEYGASYPNYPVMTYVIASLDTAYTEKSENDPSALTIWGLFYDVDENPKVMLMDAWQKHLIIHGEEIERLSNETEKAWKLRTSDKWGLVEWVAYSCKRYKVDLLLVESKSAGYSVVQELKRLHRFDGFGVRLMDPGNADKIARAHAVSPFFYDGQIYAPDRKWADEVITQCESFPKAAHDDLVDTTSQAIKYLRDSGLLQRNADVRADFIDRAMHRPQLKPVYEA